MSTVASRFRSNVLIVLAAIGGILLLGNISLFQIGSLLNLLMRWWPLALVMFGVMTLLRGKTGSFNRALFFTVIGLLLQIAMLGWLPSDTLEWWPLISIVLGLWLLFVQPKDVTRSITISEPVINYHAMLEGTRITVSSGSFVEGTLKARLAMLESDFASALPAPVPLSLSVDVFAGSMTLTLPDSWRVTTEMNLTLGTLRDERKVGNPPLLPGTPQLRVSGAVSLGSLVFRDIYAEAPDSAENI